MTLPMIFVTFCLHSGQTFSTSSSHLVMHCLQYRCEQESSLTSNSIEISSRHIAHVSSCFLVDILARDVRFEATSFNKWHFYDLSYILLFLGAGSTSSSLSTSSEDSGSSPISTSSSLVYSLRFDLPSYASLLSFYSSLFSSLLFWCSVGCYLLFDRCPIPALMFVVNLELWLVLPVEFSASSARNDWDDFFLLLVADTDICDKSPSISDSF